MAEHEHTISRQRILEALAAAGPPGLQVTELALALGLEPRQGRVVRDRLRELVQAGDVQRQGRHYRLPDGEQAQTEVGVLQLHPSGRGYVDRGEAYDGVLVLPRQRGGAMDGDTVEVEVHEGRRREMGRVIRVIARGRVRLTGTVAPDAPDVLVPDDPRIPSRVELVERGVQARPGQAVLASIVAYPETPDDPVGVAIERVLGEPGLLLTEVAKSVGAAGVAEEFPAEVVAEAEAAPPAVREEDLRRRLDLRKLHFVTIDPLAARDFDDAVAVEPGPSATRVWVAVADVSHYVHEGSLLDQEARRRGCSLYLPDRAIPMLPAPLSSGICSLVPGQDRLAMVVRLDVSKSGRIVDEACAAAVIHSQGRLDYHGVAAALGGDFAGRRQAYLDHAEELAALQRVASALRRQRLARGSLDLDLPEPEVLLDQDDPNRVRDIVPSRPDAPVKLAYGLIEELMVAANEAVARLFQRAGQPTIWRVHAAPRPDALRTLAAWMASYGLQLETDRPGERAIAALLARLREHRARRPLSYLVLRTLKQASYSVTNVGHFGLASPAYLHFTSPIRRYPDLQVHRLVKALLARRGEPAGRRARAPKNLPSEETLGQIARQASAKERRAIEVEREVHRVYAASLVRDRIGDNYWGTISGLGPMGFFVALDRPFVEGLVRADTLPEAVSYDADLLRLVGRRGRRNRVCYSLGDRVLVRVADTSVLRRQVDLELVEGPDSHEPDPALEGRRLVAPARRGAERQRGQRSYRRPRPGRRERAGRRRRR